jgi:hypothetical protein
VDSQLAGGNVYAFEGWHAGLLYVLTGDARYGRLAVSFVDADVTSEEAKINATPTPMVPDVAGDDYLYVGDHVGDLALTYDWCFDLLTPTQKSRWIAYANQAVYNVWHNTMAMWGGKSFPWNGWSVDNPVNNYYFSFLRATMLLGLATRGENPMADTWLTTFRTNKIGAQLVPTYLSTLQGGGSLEGTGYGIAMRDLFRLYDEWGQTTTEHIEELTPHAHESIPWLLHAIVPTRDRLAPIGDHARDSTASLFDYHRDYLQVLAQMYPNDAAAQVARGFWPTSSVPEMSQQFMRYSDFLYDATGATTRPLTALYPLYHATGTGMIFVRSSWDKTATWASLMAGPYTESHAHHDQGQLLVYKNEWLAYDANIDSHSGLRQDEESHNLVRIENAGTTVEQRAGGQPSTLSALHDEAAFTYFSADVAPIYGGQGVQLDRRDVVFVKPDVFVVLDRVTTQSTAARRVFQLNVPVQPTIAGSRATVQGTTSKLELIPILPGSPTPAVIDDKTRIDPGQTMSDFNAGFRIDIAQTGMATAVFLNVISLDGAVTAEAASNTSTQTGVTLTLADGRHVTVHFNDAAAGGTLDIMTGGQTMTSPLPATVASYPVLAP